MILALSASWRFNSAFCIFGGFLPYIRCDDTDICDAADTRERSAALAPFQRIQPNTPLHKIVNSAVSRLLPACHFGGFIANYAIGMMR